MEGEGSLDSGFEKKRDVTWSVLEETGPANVRSRPLRVPPLYPPAAVGVRTAELLSELVRRGARWKYLSSRKQQWSARVI